MWDAAIHGIHTLYYTFRTSRVTTYARATRITRRPSRVKCPLRHIKEHSPPHPQLAIENRRWQGGQCPAQARHRHRFTPLRKRTAMVTRPRPVARFTDCRRRIVLRARCRESCSSIAIYFWKSSSVSISPTQKEVSFKPPNSRIEADYGTRYRRHQPAQ